MIKKIITITAFFILGVVSLFGKTYRVATYNVKNYLVTDRWIEGRGYRKEHPKPETETQALREVIREVNPDILVLQEMGGENFLKELQNDLKYEGANYPYKELLQSADPVRHVAILSREPFKEVHRHDDLSFTYLKHRRESVKRGLLEVVFDADGTQWSLFGLHLKSRSRSNKNDFESEKQRTGEAVAIRAKIKQRFPKESKGLYIVVGDFNDHSKSKALKRFLKSGERTLAVKLPATDSRNEVWTHFWRSRGVYSRIDYILASPEMYPKIKEKRASVCDMPFVMEASDHRMLYADIEI